MSLNNPEMMSFLKLRKYIGVLGFFLPILIICRVGLLSSISYSYYTPAHDIFVGSLYLIGGFFIGDKGYDLKDTIANRICGACALLVANFPCNGQYAWVHYVSAFILFSMLGYISCFLFTKSAGAYNYMKGKRNAVYSFCGKLIFMNVLIIAAFSYSGLPIFIPESLCLFPFGIAWIVKGKVLLTDK